MVRKALELLKAGTPHAFRPQGDSVLVVTSNAIVMRHFDAYRGAEQDVLAVKVGGQIIGNSSALNRGRSQATPEQLELSELVPMIPFGVLKQARLNLATFREVDKGPEETIYRAETLYHGTKGDADKLKADKSLKDLKIQRAEGTYGNGETRFNATYLRPRHFTGARLFSVDGRLFLMDVDRVELRNGLINPFLVELQDAGVKTVADAYQSLKPDAVKDAERDGLKVLRQGEWFFVPVTSELLAKRIERELDKRRAEAIARGENVGWIERWGVRGELRAGQNRPNQVTMFQELDGANYVSGTVSHTGREHADLELNGYYLAVPNTSITSWTISGDVD